MSETAKVVLALTLAGFCVFFAMILVFGSPDPMPAANAQLLAALIALFSASGYAALRLLGANVKRRAKSNE